MHWFTVDYRKRDGAVYSGGRISRGFWLFGVPRPLMWCRLFGHRPLVDGYGPHRPGLHAARWVVCDRCAVRPEPQGDLDPEVWNIGDRYTGTYSTRLPTNDLHRAAALKALKRVAGSYPPGPWPRGETGELGGQIVLFPRREPTFGFTLKVGNKGSEHTLAADFHLPWIMSLYLHTERFGSWLVHRLNGVGYESKVISVELSHGRLTWRLWVNRDGGRSSRAPWRDRIRDGSVRIDPRTLLLGPQRYEYDGVGEPVEAAVRMPHGDDHQVMLKLQRRAFGRRHGRKRLSWNVEWKATSGGIPTKPGSRGRIYGSGVEVSNAAAADGTWSAEAAALIAVRMTEERRLHDWRPAQAAAAA